MNRFFLLLLALILLGAPAFLAAQMGGGHGGHGGSGRQSPTPGNGTAADDFHKAVALQATDEQRAQFQTATKDTDAATKLAEDLRQSSSQPAESSQYAGQAAALKAAIGKSRSATDQLLQGFDKEQKSGMKDLIKKLNKAGDNVASRWKAFSDQLERTKATDRIISGSAEELVRALADFRSRQTALGAEMGIQQ